MTEKIEPDFYGGHGYVGDGIHGCDVMLGGSVVRCGAGIMQHMWVTKMTEQQGRMMNRPELQKLWAAWKVWYTTVSTDYQWQNTQIEDLIRHFIFDLNQFGRVVTETEVWDSMTNKTLTRTDDE